MKPLVCDGGDDDSVRLPHFVGVNRKRKQVTCSSPDPAGIASLKRLCVGDIGGLLGVAGLNGIAGQHSEQPSLKVEVQPEKV